MNLTPIARPALVALARRSDNWTENGPEIQLLQLRSLLRRAAHTEMGRLYGFSDLARMRDPRAEFARRVPLRSFEDIRRDVMRMIAGQQDILWPGVCRHFAQSSGTSGGKSKYIPITDDSLHRCHYRGAAYSVAHYLRINPRSRMFSGKGLILGGSFANELNLPNPDVKVGDLSATLIDRINPVANMFRIPDRKTALLPDWRQKLPAIVKASVNANVTNISGVPSWFLTLLRNVMAEKGVETISEVWPNLEVFFHGGISFEPYREIYRAITDPEKMHFMETYNASEGFFAVQDRHEPGPLLLLLDNDIYYEFIDVEDPEATPVGIEGLDIGKVYEMVITSSSGLWRYRIGDTVRLESLAPVRIRIAGRTSSFINAFGEELMQDNADRGIAEACQEHDAEVENYTVAPVFASGKRRGRHQWLVEWIREPKDPEAFAISLDNSLRRLNSDYDAKRNNTIFLDPPEIVTIPRGTFDRWLATVGNRKLGGQKKIPRLANDRHVADAVLALASEVKSV